MSKRYVYNPADEDLPLAFQYNAVEFPLAPNAVTTLESPWPHIPVDKLLEVCLGRTAEMGVIEVASAAADIEEIQRAETLHTEYVRQRVTKVLSDRQRVVKEHEALGLTPPDEPPAVAAERARAKRWKLIAALLLSILPWPARADEAYTRPVTAKYDLDSTTETFCALNTREIDGPGRITTSGSSTTVTAVGSAEPFTDVAVNDQLVITGVIGQHVRTVVARASATSITVDAAVDLSATGGYAFQYRVLSCGTGATDGWFGVSSLSATTVTIDITQIVATGGIDVRIQCASGSNVAAARQVYPLLTPPAAGPTYLNFPTATASGVAVEITGSWSRCRVGMKIGSADDGDDATTNREQVTIQLDAARPQ
jgi:hypothetical protein